MRVNTKIYSWLLATAYLAFGALFSHIVSSLQSIFSSFAIQLPLSKRVVFGVGPMGWQVIAAVVAILIIGKDRKFRSRLLNSLFTVLLFLWVGFTFALLSPMFYFGGGLH